MAKPTWRQSPAEKQQEQLAAKRVLEEKRKAMVEKLSIKKEEKTEPVKKHKIEIPVSPETISVVPAQSPLDDAHTSRAESALFDRDHPDAQLHTEKWARDLINLMLTASVHPGIHICLVWPGRPLALPLFHAQATLARLAIKDLKGIRTLMYPVKQTTYHAFHHFLLDRDLLIKSVRQVWADVNGRTEMIALRSCEGKSELLMALANIKNYKPDTPYPTVSEVIPTFHYKQEADSWGTYEERYLARSITKLSLAHRRAVREKVKSSLSLPENAPDAIFGIPYGTKKATWAKALNKKLFKSNKFDLLLLDATSDMQKTNYKSIQLIPEFIASYRESLGSIPGTVIVTDNPATAFHLKKRLADEFSLRSTIRIHVTEKNETGFCIAKQPDDFIPAQRGLRHYGVAIMDRDACSLALTLQKSSNEFGADAEMQQACLNVAHYLMQLCHLPGGYADLGNWLEEEERNSYLTAKLTWPNRFASLQRLLTAGRAGAFSRSIEQALAKADGFIQNWTDATPMALRLLKEVSKISPKSKHNLGLVFLQSSYIPIAERFLRRKLPELGKSYEDLRSHLEYINFREFHKRPESFSTIERFIFVGATDDLLRILLATDLVPAHSSLFLSYRQAYSYQQQLNILKSLDELRPYKGRVGELALEFDQRLSEIPNPIAVEKLRVPNFNFDFDAPPASSGDEYDSPYWTLTLEGNDILYSTKRVYKYNPDEDPPFKSVNVESIKIGDSVFCMTEDLRQEVEATLRSLGFTSFSRGSSFAAMLDIYHQHVRTQSATLYPAKNRREQARKILEKMIEINEDMKDCTLSRVGYWLDLDSTEADRAPQAARDWKHFEAFAKALAISEVLYKDFWIYAINSTRREHQIAGRELTDFYTNILFAPESLQVYQKVPQKTIGYLMQRALDCVFSVMNIDSPTASQIKDMEA
mgnify:CR=1 FL=1